MSYTVYTVEVNGFGYQHSVKYLLCSAEEGFTGLEQHVGEQMMTTFSILSELSL